MAYGRKWKPSKTQAREFAQKMGEIEQFCSENGISNSYSNDSYYFTLNGTSYRVSNHSVESSYKNSGGKYHQDGRNDETVYIHASKKRIMEIYTNLQNGLQLDNKGNVKAIARD